MNGASLRLKLTLLLASIVGMTLLVAWIVTGRTILQPFAREVMEVYLDEVVYVADKIVEGANPNELGRKLNLEVRLVPQRPPFIDSPKLHRKMRCQTEMRGHRELTHCRGRRAPVAVRTDLGWVVVRRDLDVAAPGSRIGQLLLGLALVVFVFSALVAMVITKPLNATTEAMNKMAAGDLSHRLPVGGGRELADAARAFNAMADRVDALLRAERELMAGISHELRTPLARLRLQTEMLRDEGVPEKRLAAIDADLVEIDRLIGELLESSRLTLGDRMLAREELDLEAIVRDAVNKTPLPKHNVSIDVSGARKVAGDRTRLVRAVGNLLQNAGKYAPESSEIEVIVRGGEVEVRDRGPGVPEHELPHLFEPFYRGVRARQDPNKSGLGLGLMIARQVIDLHGGTISAKNREDGGLAIRFELPA